MSGGGRVASLLRAEGSALSAAQPSKSLYRPDPSESATSSYQYPSSSGGHSPSGRSGAPPSAGESYVARDKYSNAKSISSDQFFGQDDAHAAEMRTRLDKYAGASAISSDMVYHNAAPVDYSQQGNGGVDLDRLKDSVKDFFQDISRNMR
ncbi:unnamed protein product [Symbiodinium microadriaticum]|nr:unnamed protein product [Symbiodinium microadriaticum]